MTEQNFRSSEKRNFIVVNPKATIADINLHLQIEVDPKLPYRHILKKNRHFRNAFKENCLA